MTPWMMPHTTSVWAYPELLIMLSMGKLVKKAPNP